MTSASLHLIMLSLLVDKMVHLRPLTANLAIANSVPDQSHSAKVASSSDRGNLLPANHPKEQCHCLSLYLTTSSSNLNNPICT